MNEDRRVAAFLLSAACAILAACGGADGGAPPPAAAAPIATPQANAAPMAGRTAVVLNAVPQAQPTEPGKDDPARIVAVARAADGTLRLQQGDGSVRVIAPDGQMVLRPGAAGAALQGELPSSMIVAVDAGNTVHTVDPGACMARTISPDGRVMSRGLPAPRADTPCAAVPRTR